MSKVYVKIKDTKFHVLNNSIFYIYIIIIINICAMRYMIVLKIYISIIV